MAKQRAERYGWLTPTAAGVRPGEVVWAKTASGGVASVRLTQAQGPHGRRGRWNGVNLDTLRDVQIVKVFSSPPPGAIVDAWIGNPEAVGVPPGLWVAGRVRGPLLRYDSARIVVVFTEGERAGEAAGARPGSVRLAQLRETRESVGEHRLFVYGDTAYDYQQLGARYVLNRDAWQDALDALAPPASMDATRDILWQRGMTPRQACEWLLTLGATQGSEAERLLAGKLRDVAPTLVGPTALGGDNLELLVRRRDGRLGDAEPIKTWVAASRLEVTR